MSKELIPVFYACDENYVNYTHVSIYSLKKNASRDYKYAIHILNCGMDPEKAKECLDLSEDWFEVTLVDVSAYLESIADKLPVRDYFSITTYYRFFIAELFPEYPRSIYIDSDTVVQGDVSELFFTDIGESYLAACPDKIVVEVDVFGQYVEQVVGVSRYNYLQAGVLLLNGDRFRTGYVLDKFIQLLREYDFRVAQDQDYLNVICKDHVYFLDRRWNTETSCSVDFPIEKAAIIHYNMASTKPWHHPDAPFADIFWQYASETAVYEKLKERLKNYSEEQRHADDTMSERLMGIVMEELEREDGYLKQLNNSQRSSDRVAIVKKIEELEREGRFDEDVENDPPSKVLMPDDIEYIRKGISEKFKTKFAFMIARQFVNNLIEDKKLIIKEIKGIENFKNLKSGAVITCNHFNAFDSFAIQFAYDASEQTERTFYRVIKEGNYTSFPGFYGFLMRHCNTLPLSSNPKTLTKFMEAANKLLKDGHFMLVYPEQSMWWNYRKPKPLKTGAYILAARNNVPVLPCFITMKDSDVMGDDGFYVQEYTINVAEPIYPDLSLSYRKRIEDMKDRNFEVWKQIYENVYQLPLEYTTGQAE